MSEDKPNVDRTQRGRTKRLAETDRVAGEIKEKERSEREAKSRRLRELRLGQDKNRNPG